MRSMLNASQPRAAELATPPRKWQRILFALVEGRQLTRFDAELIGDHCLHTTVASLENRGIQILRDLEVIGGRFGASHCKRYRLAPESLERARELLGLKGQQAPA